MKQHTLENHIYNMDCLTGCKLLEAGSVDFIIADPPFYRVKGEFDFSFQSFEEYKEKMKEWAEAFKRVLKPNRYLVIYGDYRRIAYVQVIFDNYFTLRNNCIVAKTNSPQKKIQNLFVSNSFLINEERFLIYENTPDNYIEGVKGKNIKAFLRGNDRTYYYAELVLYFLEEKKKAKLTASVCKQILGNSMYQHYFTDKSQWAFPSETDYKKIQENTPSGCFEKRYEDLSYRYELLKSRYKPTQKYFYLETRQDDIFNVKVDSRLRKKYGHDTPKNLQLTKELIRTMSKKGDLVLVPFVGSGTECVAALQMQRKFVGFEINEKYCKASNRRIKKESQLDLF